MQVYSETLLLIAIFTDMHNSSVCTVCYDFKKSLIYFFITIIHVWIFIILNIRSKKFLLTDFSYLI